ncbi:TetR/AcrR family transcriptional regulator C-terminal domain-containing protein [Anaerotignum lactatifermentans]|uniref:TetR/AcrR family transcriptional regulator C-terminal domain-containing protein n=1 Tax=Anaerotignum lactatifermentans TaxID=160404 RepID=A0ABS2G9D6_9FIRM|nr:TetR/AcrR family transcriptional regulator C-terminal domain-containing protein [Anaerotignum lactatifermentans]MBM6829273.1 TetR/AcrR family transcriptional regulator C-terminal domain-containing protein [Anaerotignum lactatifermentans]MBM6877487.1 TetR/AcrR family transcriptional regulator C-terminal domain-containing protein [Anaerotignum lactatifermentans]MBM6950851.1 TetR/AcrR family transcriptional regulator C-terminal domain-containing protein [Anaerotignum lactatifermentans]
MHQKTQATRESLAESLKKLMAEHSFERITIKDITDGAGFIRPTFYNHFKDKYDLVEWIFQEEVILPTKQLFQMGMFREGIRLMLVTMEKEKDFYLRAAKIKGQNSFRRIVFESISGLIFEILSRRAAQGKQEQTTDSRLFSPEILAEYYANAETFLLLKWIEHGMRASAEEMEKVHSLLISFSFEDVIREISQ